MYSNFSYASLSGSVPTTVGYLSYVKFFNLHENSVTDSIPSTLGYLT